MRFPVLLAGLLAGLAFSLVVVAPASAARVSVRTHSGANFLRYQAASGERNAPHFAVRAHRAVVRDSRVALVAGHGCASLSIHEVACRPAPAESFDFVRARLGDGNDRVMLGRSLGGVGGNVLVDGGAGADVLDAHDVNVTAFLSGGPGRDRLTGGSGGDVLSGGSGPDRLYGGAGQDQLRPDPPGAGHSDDLVDGGRGVDLVDYRGRASGVTVDLGKHSGQGVAGESDTFIGVEGVDATDHDDVLTGSAHADDLLGEKGHDTISGLAGDDRTWAEGGGPDQLRGGAGNDVVILGGGGIGDGGAGDDQLEGRSGSLVGGAGDDAFDVGAARVDCAEGDDTVTVTHTAGPTVDSSCESMTITEDGLGLALPLVRADDGLRAGISCDEEDGRVPICHDTMTVARGAQPIAAKAYSISDGSRTLTLPYQEGGREALGSDPVQVRVTVGRYAFTVIV